MNIIKKIINSSSLAIILIIVFVISFLFFAKPVKLQQKENSKLELIAKEDLELEFIETVLKFVDKFYVDKSKIDNNKILIEGINQLEIALDEVLIEFPDKNNTRNLTIQVNESKKSYKNLNVKNADDIINVLRNVFSFIIQNINEKEVNIRDLEYAVSNKILKTLDSHSAIITPDIYKEFLIETEGSFGGLGIVIGIREGNLTVISPIEGTPAFKAGIKPNDKIVQIESESTINMTLVEAVGKLRGKKGTKVNIFVMRESFPKPRMFSITRDTIKIESVEAFDIAEDILYIRIRDFQRNTFSSLKDEIESRNGKTIGVILDLRGNPGGLLDQAQKISDLFLEKGTVVTTKVGNSSKSYNAEYKVPEYDGKLVVLVDEGSASASEIVAGALKNNNRAIVLGQRTFGKGSVQQIFDLKDGSALKLTIANYFTPGDISIQDIGITPDIILKPSVISINNLIYNPLEDEYKKNEQKNSVYSIKYLYELSEEKEKLDKPEEAYTKVEKMERLYNDFYIKLAKDIIIRSNSNKRPNNLKEVKDIIDNIIIIEEEKIGKKMGELGIDWTYGEANKPLFSVELNPDTPLFLAGTEQSINIIVKNNGINPIYRLSGITDSDNTLYKGKELLFGKLNPGEIKSWKLKFDIPKWLNTREDKIEIKFTDSSNKTISNYSFNIKTVEKEQPVFSYNYEIIDDGRLNTVGNGNSILTENETAVLNVTIKNTGKGVSDNTIVTLKNLSGDNVFLEEGRFQFENFSPGKIHSVPFKFKVVKPTEDIEFEIQILEESFREIRTAKIKLPNNLSNQDEFLKSSKLVSIIKDNTLIYGSNFKGSSPIASINKNSLISAEGILGNWVKVANGKDFKGWIKKENIRLIDNKIAVNKINQIQPLFNKPPSIKIENIPLSTKNSKITISGLIEDEDKVKNILFYKVDDKIKLINKKNEKIPFSFSISLDEGINIFNIIAKDLNDNISKKTFTIRREG